MSRPTRRGAQNHHDGARFSRRSGDPEQRREEQRERVVEQGPLWMDVVVPLLTEIMNDSKRNSGHIVFHTFRSLQEFLVTTGVPGLPPQRTLTQMNQQIFVSPSTAIYTVPIGKISEPETLLALLKGTEQQCPRPPGSPVDAPRHFLWVARIRTGFFRDQLNNMVFTLEQREKIPFLGILASPFYCEYLALIPFEDVAVRESVSEHLPYYLDQCENIRAEEKRIGREFIKDFFAESEVPRAVAIRSLLRSMGVEYQREDEVEPAPDPVKEPQQQEKGKEKEQEDAEAADVEILI